MKTCWTGVALLFFCLMGCEENAPGNSNGADQSPALGDFYDALEEDALAFGFEQGAWTEDFGDAAAFGPAYYARMAAKTGDAQHVAFAQSSRDYNLEAVSRAANDPFWMLGNLEEVFMTVQGLIEYAGVTGEEELIEPIDDLLDLLDDVLASADDYIDASVGEFAADLYGPTSITAGMAVVFLQYATYLDTEKKSDRISRAVDMLDSIGEKAFHVDHYRFRPGEEKLFLYPNATMLIALNRAYQLTGEMRFLDRAKLVYQGIQSLKKSEFGFYYSPYSADYQGAQSDEYGTLSAQNYLLLGLLLQYQNTQESTYLEDAIGILHFIRDRLYDTEEGKLLHHWIDGRPAEKTDPDYFCSGCNLQTLYILVFLRDELDVSLD